MSDLIDRQAAIDAEGLDAQIRCEMCRNPMHTDRGCDGNCKYDEKLYERIMQILDERIKPLPSAQPEERTEERTKTHACDLISRQAAIKAIENCTGIYVNNLPTMINKTDAYKVLTDLPPAQPYTDEEIQTMQDMEQAQLDKAFELGREDGRSDIVRCIDCKYCQHWYADKGRCFLWHETGIDVFEDGFCSYAERRTDGVDS